MTPREHIIESVTSRIKCGRATNVHEAIEGYVEDVKGVALKYYEGATYAAIGRLIKAIERRAQ